MARVVVIGGGFCGVSAAKKLLKKGLDVTLIDPKDFFEFTPSVYKALDPGYEGKITAKFSDILKGARILGSTVECIEKDHVVAGGKKIGFDYLVIATGSVTPIPKAAANLFIIKRLSDVIAMRAQFARAKTAVVCGGGHVGIEVAALFSSRGKKVTIIDSEGRLVYRAPQRASRIAKDRLEKMGVDVILGELVQGVRESTVISLNHKLKADIVVWAIGIKPNAPFLFGTSLAGKSGVFVNDFLQSRQQNVFAGGDVAEIKVEKTAQNAQIQGKVIAENIWRHSKGRPLKPYQAKATPLVVDLQGSGIFIWGNLVISSFFFSWLKKAVEIKEMLELRM